MNDNVIEFPIRESVVVKHKIHRRTVTRLGGKLHQYSCDCGIRVEHPDEDQAKNCFFGYHADLLLLPDRGWKQ